MTAENCIKYIRIMDDNRNNKNARFLIQAETAFLSLGHAKIYDITAATRDKKSFSISTGNKSIYRLNDKWF